MTQKKTVRFIDEVDPDELHIFHRSWSTERRESPYRPPPQSYKPRRHSPYHPPQPLSSTPRREKFSSFYNPSCPSSYPPTQSPHHPSYPLSYTSKKESAYQSPGRYVPSVDWRSSSARTHSAWQRESRNPSSSIWQGSATSRSGSRSELVEAERAYDSTSSTLSSYSTSRGGDLREGYRRERENYRRYGLKDGRWR
ncbi:hypothetical protein K470DRAFT_262160 [Piedraia hortae CBS 480.64]|uniref:Uncharacterized protein n=1 Tax=Piedraia hortae CBS 480.64 TaxID=1314780 RepID=A0A6A7C835_9PEZI|nr:hypothetical protein K470DRAFT_262160 [Piedraia hortae CBS 480.64]